VSERIKTKSQKRKEKESVLNMGGGGAKGRKVELTPGSKQIAASPFKKSINCSLTKVRISYRGKREGVKGKLRKN